MKDALLNCNYNFLLDLVEIDIMSQINSLKNGGELDWDCYDIASWEAMLYNFKEGVTGLKKINSSVYLAMKEIN